MNICKKTGLALSLLAGSALMAGAQTTFTADGIYYKVLSTSPARVSVERNAGSNYTGSVNIPASVNYEGTDYSVTAIGRGAFYNSMELTSVGIGANVAEIGVSAFAGCMSLQTINVDAANAVYSSREGVLFTKDGLILEKFPAAYASDSYTVPDGVQGIQVQAFDYTRDLTAVSFPSSLREIGAYAFMASSILEVDLPDGVTTLGDYAFYQCPALGKATLGKGITAISGFCFNSCGELSSVTLKGAVESIGEFAFFSCFKLQEFDLPASLRSIGNGAFKSCESLRRVSIGKNVASIGVVPWSFCKALRSFEVDADNASFLAIGGVLFSKDGKTLIEYPAGRPGEYEVPDGTATIGPNAFYYCTKLTEVSIPASVTKIGDSAFHACSGLTMVAVPAAEIGSQAFMFCENMKSVHLRENVKSIGTLAFSMCDALSYIFAQPAQPPVLASENIFSDNTYANATLEVTDVDAYKSAFGWKLFRNCVSPIHGIGESTAEREVASQMYIGLDGQQYDAPVRKGIYIVRTVYTDGTSSTQKQIVK